MESTGMAALAGWLRRRTAQTMGACVGIALAASVGVACAQGAPTSDPAQDGLNQHIEWIKRALRPSPNVPHDAELRRSAQAMVEQALPRMRERVTLWLAEEQAHAPNSTLAVQLHAVAMRSYNEMALWRLDSAGPEHDKRQQRALSHPRACSAHLNNTSLMDDLLQVWQWVPLTERAAFLDAEASLLQRWGMARERSAQRPATTVDEAAWQAIDEAARTGAALPLALPPALSWYLFDEASNAATRRPASIVCTLRQWSLQSQLRASGGVLSDAQWWAHRFARMPDALTWRGRDANAMRGDSKYPELARRLDVEGTVRVAVTLDAQGRVVRTAVVGRDIRAAGIREQLPLAFETLLDEAAVASAAAVKTTKPEPEQLKDGHYTGTITLSFKIQ